MKKYVFTPTIFSLCITLFAACSHKSLDNLVGNDRDDHGCLTSAGYQWSYALNDCVRIWEVGERFESGQKNIFLVFSPDSTFAEIHTEDKGKILCKRIKGTETWRPKKGKEYVSIANGVTTVHVDHFDYTKTITNP